MHHTAQVNGENSEVPVQKRLKSKSQNGSKKSKGSLRRRMQSIFTSPVHLFRRYVLRKRPKRNANKELEDDTNGIKNVAAIEAVESAKERNLPCYFLFLGLQQSGKSTTISKLFNGKRPTQNESGETRSIRVYKNKSVGQEIGLKIVDTPGLCGSELEQEQDTEIVRELSSFLKQDLPHRIPTVTFIVARLDEKEDERQQSEEESHFTRVLKTLSRAENYITDQLYSNIVLLLTHSQQASDVSAGISKYQDEFAKVFPVTNPITVIPIDNIRYSSKCADKQLPSYHEIIFEGLKDFAEKRQNHTLKALMDWMTGKARRFSIAFQKEVVPLSANSIATDCHRMTLNEHKNASQDCEPYFVLHHTEGSNTKKRKSQKNDKERISQQQLQTCIPPGSHILLEDKSLISIDKCLVGDKVLGLHFASSVITAMRKTTTDQVAMEGKSVGSVYCSQIENDVNGTSKDEKVVKSKSIYVYTNDAFELVDACKANVPEKTNTDNLYFVELDRPNGTVVVNGIPCFASSVSRSGTDNCNSIQN